MSTALAGAPLLLRASLKHDGRRFAPWIVIVTALTISSVLVYPLVFPDASERAELALAIGANPALSLIFGPAFDLSTTDGFNAWRSLSLGGFLVGLGAIFTVTRSTRGQEDSGQAELLAAGVLGRESRLLAGLGLALIGSLLAGVVAGLFTVLCGGAWQASMLLGATFTATGWMFAGVAAVTAQLGADVHTANTLAVGVLGALYFMRGFAYAVEADTWTVWANPLGWMTETRPGTDENWWPLAAAVGFTLILVTAGFVLQARRDFGQGSIAPRPGPARGRARSTLQLVRRLHAGSLITWGVAFVALGTVFGYFARAIKDILQSNKGVAQVLAAGAASPADLIAVFIVTILSMLGIIAAIPGVQLMLKVRAEELDDRVELLLAGAVSRARYYGSNLLVAFVSVGVYVLIAGTVVGALAAPADIGVDFWPTVAQAAVTIPAVWTVVAVSVAVVGARPAVTLAAWVGVLISFVLTLLGPTFKLWDWVLAISPFWHVPRLTDSSAESWGLLAVSGVTLLFVLVGFVGFRRRDIAVTH